MDGLIDARGPLHRPLGAFQLNHQVDIAVGSGIAARSTAEKDNPAWMDGISDLSDDLVDGRL